MMENAVKEVQISARFPRVVTFVYERDPYWIDTIQRIVEIYTVMWGGYNWLIIPFDIRNGKIYVDEVFRSLVRDYDPDIVWIYNPSNLDIEMADKRLFRKKCESLKKEYKDYGIDISDMRVIVNIRNVPYTYRRISHLFQSEKFYFPLFHNVSRTSEPRVTYRKLIEDVNFSSIRWLYEHLFVGNDFFSKLIDDGRISNFIFYLKDKFLNTVMYAITGKLPFYDINRVGLEGKRPLSPIKGLLKRKTRYVVYDAVRSKFRNKLSLDNFIVEFLSYDNKYPIKKEGGLIYNAYNEPLYIVLGNRDVKSFLIYFNLLRLGYLALYLPKGESSDYSRNILREIVNYNKEIFLITDSDGSGSEFIRGLIDKYSVDDVFFSLMKDKANKLSFYELAIEDVFRKEDLFKDLERWRLIYINEFLIQKTKEELYLNFYSIEAMLSRIPYANLGNVIFEFKIRNLPLLQKEVFLERIFLNEFKRYFHFSRVDNNGRIVIWFQTPFTPIGNLPFLKSISPEDYFRYFFSQKLEISDKGVFSKLFFANAKVYYEALLEKIFLSKFRWIIPSFLIKAKENTNHYSIYFLNSEMVRAIRDKNCGLGLVVKEKEKAIFALQDFEKLNYFFFRKGQDESYRKKSIEFLRKFRSFAFVPEDDELRDFLNFMIENNILEEGLFLKCSYCSQSWFYTFSEFDEDNQFRCIYCKRRQKLKLSNHRNKFPLIFLSVTDYVYRLFKQNGDLVLLTLLWILKRYNPQNFIWSWELKYPDKFEVDFIAVSDGKLLLAECKKLDDGFGTIEFPKFKEAIEFFDPSVIVLSSFSESDAKIRKVVDELRSSFPEKKLEVLTKRDFESLWE